MESVPTGDVDRWIGEGADPGAPDLAGLRGELGAGTATSGRGSGRRRARAGDVRGLVQPRLEDFGPEEKDRDGGDDEDDQILHGFTSTSRASRPRRARPGP